MQSIATSTEITAIRKRFWQNITIDLSLRLTGSLVVYLLSGSLEAALFILLALLLFFLRPLFIHYRSMKRDEEEILSKDPEIGSTFENDKS